MMINKKLDKIFKKSQRLVLNDNNKIVIMSDCHRGTGDNFDNFFKNKNIYIAALSYYYNNNFTYIELGDGDEMWENKNYQEIINNNIDVFRLLKKFNDSKRLIMIYGNHDISKKSSHILEKYFYKYYNQEAQKEELLLANLVVNESLVLNYNNYDIFLIHGHQADHLNSFFWRISRFLVRFIWRTLERLGLKDPTSSAKNNHVIKKNESKLKKWSIKSNKILIAGHTHRPLFPQIGQSRYFNDGSCIHPNGITCIEIENGQITLVKWHLKYANGFITVGREVLAGKEPIINFFSI